MASEDEAEVKLLLQCCKDNCTLQPKLTARLVSALSSCNSARSQCLIIEQLSAFCLSTPREVQAIIAAYEQCAAMHPSLLLPIIASLADISIPPSCQPQLHRWIMDALASAAPL